MFSAFNPSKCTHLEQQWASDCAAPGEQSLDFLSEPGFEPTTLGSSGFKVHALSIRPTTARVCAVYCKCMRSPPHQQQVRGEESQGANSMCMRSTTHQSYR